MSRNGWRKSTSISRKCSSSENRWGVFSYINITASPLYYKLLHLSVFWKMLYWVPHCSIALLKSPRPSLLIKWAALGNLKTSFHCTHWHRFFPLKQGIFLPLRLSCKESSTFLTKPLFPQGREDVTALRCSEPLRYKVGGPSKVSPCCAGWDRLSMNYDGK